MKVNRKELVSVLESIQPSLESGGSAGTSDVFHFEGGFVSSTNDVISISNRLPKGVTLETDVKANELLAILKKITADQVDVTVGPNEVLVSTADTKASIKTMEFKKNPALDPQGPWTPIPEDFTEKINIAKSICSDNVSNVILSYVHCEGEYCHSTDNIQIMRVQFKSALAEPIMLPAGVIKYLASYDISEACHSIPGWVFFRNSQGTTFGCRTLMAEYPDMDRFFITEGDELALSTENISKTVDRLSTIIAEGYDRVEITPIKGGVLMETKGPFGWVKERVKTSAPITCRPFAVSMTVLKKMCETSAKFIITPKTVYIHTGDVEYTALLKMETEAAAS